MVFSNHNVWPPSLYEQACRPCTRLARWGDAWQALHAQVLPYCPNAASVSHGCACLSYRASAKEQERVVRHVFKLALLCT